MAEGEEIEVVVRPSETLGMVMLRKRSLMMRLPVVITA
jgi:hypothetical protein